MCQLLYPAYIENADMMFMDFAMALLLLSNTGDYFPIDKFRSGKCLLEIHIQCLVNIAGILHEYRTDVEDRINIYGEKMFLVLNHKESVEIFLR